MPVKLNSMLNGKYSWWRSGSIIDADFQNSRFIYNGQTHTNEASWLTAIGGTKTGNTRTISPKVVGPELVADPGFDSGINGWVDGVTYEALGTPSWNSSMKRLQIDVVGRSAGAAVQYRSGMPVTTVISKAYQFGLRNSWMTMVSGGWNLQFGPNNLFGNTSLSGNTWSSNEQKLGYAGAVSTTSYLGVVTNVATDNAPESYDDATVREVVPLVGHNYLALSGIITGVTHSAATGNQVLFQADADSDRDRVRIVWGSDKHMILIVSFSGTDIASCDLGVVEVSTAFDIRFSSSSNSFKINLNGTVSVVDTAGSHPGIAFYRIGTSYTGENWLGTIGRLTLFPNAMADADMIIPTQAFFVFGDSTANGDGNGSPNWHTRLVTAYTPNRTIAEVAQGGEDTTALLAKAQADTDHRNWTTIFMDLPNTGETFNVWMSNIKAAVATRTTNRWYVHPPAQNSPGGTALNSAAVVTQVQQALLTDPFFTGHTLDATAQANYLAAVNNDSTRSGGGDFTHFNATGAEIQKTYIKAFMDSQGW